MPSILTCCKRIHQETRSKRVYCGCRCSNDKHYQHTGGFTCYKTSSHVKVQPLSEEKQEGFANAFGLNERFLKPRPYFEQYMDPETGK